MQHRVGTYRDGKIILAKPVDWAEGEQVIVTLVSEYVGLVEGVWPEDGSSEGEAEILRRMQEFEPLVSTPEEEAELAAAREESKRTSLEVVREKMGLEP